MKRQEQRELQKRADVGKITLDDVMVAGLQMLEVECLRCPRKGRYHVRRLVDRYGHYVQLENLKGIIAKDCPRIRAASVYDRCGVYFPSPLSPPASPGS